MIRAILITTVLSGALAAFAPTAQAGDSGIVVAFGNRHGNGVRIRVGNRHRRVNRHRVARYNRYNRVHYVPRYRRHRAPRHLRRRYYAPRHRVVIRHD